MDRAYSTLEIKSFDEATRTFEGIASTPTPDRTDDVVDPLGGEFNLPLPMMWGHGKGAIKDPVGWITKAAPNTDGVPVRGQFAIPKDDYPQTLKDELNACWVKVRDKIVRGLSIGFKPKEVEPIKGSFGVRHKRWEWLELSVVPIAMNAEASIHTIKSYDQAQRATGETLRRPVRLDPPPAVAGSRAVHSKGQEMKTYSEQIKDLEATRAAKSAERAAVMEKSMGEGRSTEQAEGEQFDALTSELEQIDKDLKRLKILESENAQTAKAVAGTDPQAASASRGNGGTTSFVMKPQAPQGIALAQLAKCMAKGQGNHFVALQIAQNDKTLDPRVVNVMKAVVSAGSTVTGNWGANLVGDETSVFADFVEFLRPQTIVGKFGTNGIPSLRRVPFRTPLVGQTAGGNGYWVGEGKGKPVTSFDFSRTTLEPLKVANIAVITEELARHSSPAADGVIRQSLADACRERLDIDFIDPAKAASAGVSPASITNGATNSASSGDTADDVRADLKTLFSTFIAADNPPTSAVFIMSAAMALSLSLMLNPMGQPEFPGVGMSGGTLMGIPVIVSEYANTDSTGGIVILVNAQDIYLGDEGGFNIDTSREASLQMDSAPTLSSVTTVAAAQLVSLWQTNSIGFRCEREISWARRRTSAVAYLTGVSWGA